ncbi:hypothetical protein [Vibrio parahaemolyticus]|uniref:hypothetical protein n=1 Tax=Vibrio parahaemolyticus TaxID=670 RepID=UPI000B79176B|nr:hypothetical protein [Vibrio parahaemolyticus]EGQ7830763.1 hypothetical protein [Vibrio parahaemolyticus]EJK2412981.1 hypothetical protein [Vibrio parahaemolyticus]OXD57046.1 hypothetical protein CA153_08200 [Vibrio parahaemolyticus]
MKKYNRVYQRVLHYYLSKAQLAEEEFLVLTTLTEDEIESFFWDRIKTVRKVIYLLGQIVEYQKSKRDIEYLSWIGTQALIPRELCLISDSIGLHTKIDVTDKNSLGLGLLSSIDRRKAIVWGLRLKHSAPEQMLTVDSGARLRYLINRISQS